MVYVLFIKYVFSSLSYSQVGLEIAVLVKGRCSCPRIIKKHNFENREIVEGVSSTDGALRFLVMNWVENKMTGLVFLRHRVALC